MEWSRIGFLGIISAANGIDSAPSEWESFGGTRLLTHDVGEERRCRGGNRRDFGRIRIERGLDWVGGTVGAIRRERAGAVPVLSSSGVD